MYQQFVSQLAKYRKALNEEVDDKTKCDSMMKIVPVAVRQHLVLNEMQSNVKKVRDTIEHLITEDAGQSLTMTTKHIASMKEEEGAGKEIDNGDHNDKLCPFGRNETRTCHNCGKPGHLAKDCKDGKGKGKGRGPKGGCHLCGGDHYQSECQKGLGKGGGKQTGGKSAGHKGYGYGQNILKGYQPYSKGYQLAYPNGGKGARMPGKGFHSFETQGQEEEEEEWPSWADPEPAAWGMIGGTFASCVEVRKKKTTRQDFKTSEDPLKLQNMFKSLEEEGEQKSEDARRQVEGRTIGGGVKRQELKKVTIGDIIEATKEKRGSEERKGRKMMSFVKKEKMQEQLKHEDEEGDEKIMQFSTPECKKGWKKMTATVDSGCTESVTNEEECSNVETVPSPQSRSGVVYEVANAETVENEGQKCCEISAQGLQGTKALTLQVAKVHKTLLSVAKLAKAGNTVVFSDVYGNYVENNFTGERIHMRKRGNLYEIDLWVRAAAFPRQGK